MITLILGAALLGLPATATAEVDAPALWKKNCKKCHGEDGKGATKLGKKMKVGDMTQAEWHAKYNDDDVVKAIADGLKRNEDGVKKKMKGYKEKLSDDERGALAKFVRSFAPQTDAGGAPEDAPEDAPKTTK